MAIGGEKASAHDASRQVGEGQLHQSTLEQLPAVRLSRGHLLGKHEMNASLPVGEFEQSALKRMPRSLRHPQQFRGRAVKRVRDPGQRRLHRRVARVGHVVIPEHVAVEAAAADMIDPVLRVPVALLVGHEERAVGLDTDTVGRAEAGGDDLGR